jgi:hypothetical protein
VLLAVVSFALFPVVTALLCKHTALHYIAVVLQYLLTAGAVGLLEDVVLLYIYHSVVVLLTVVAPLLFLFMQRHKRSFHGPWEVSKA